MDSRHVLGFGEMGDVDLGDMLARVGEAEAIMDDIDEDGYADEPFSDGDDDDMSSDDDEDNVEISEDEGARDPTSYYHRHIDDVIGSPSHQINPQAIAEFDNITLLDFGNLPENFAQLPLYLEKDENLSSSDLLVPSLDCQLPARPS